MASILDKYGIKEVADAVFYELDSKGAPSAPVLYLDTLKVSTIEQSAEVQDATGGKGNVKLISWDSNKEVTVTFEDALFSVKSLAIMFGGKVTEREDKKQEVLKTVPVSMTEIHKTSNVFDGWIVNIGKHNVFIDKDHVLLYAYKTDGDTEIDAVKVEEEAVFDYMTFDLLDAKKDATAQSAGIVQGLTINIDANTFGGTYYITGDTFARSEASGKDEYLQFIIPKAKVSSEDLSLTMEADGDPSTFNMSIKALKAKDGSMFKLVKYGFGEEAAQADNMGVVSVLTAYDKDGEENAGYKANTYQVLRENDGTGGSLPTSEAPKKSQ